MRLVRLRSTFEPSDLIGISVAETPMKVEVVAEKIEVASGFLQPFSTRASSAIARIALHITLQSVSAAETRPLMDEKVANVTARTALQSTSSEAD